MDTSALPSLSREPSGRPALRGSARREQLLDVALEVLERDGVEQLSIGEIARHVGIKPPSLYKHFDGKADIELSLIARGFEQFTADVGEALAALPAGSSRTERVAAFARAYRESALRHPQLYRLMNDRPLDRDRLDPRVESRAAAELGRLIPDVDSARSAWAWAHGLVMLEIARRFPAGADVDAAWAVLVTAVAAMPGPA